VKDRALGFQLRNPKQADACAGERGAPAADGDPPLLLPAYTLAWFEGGRVAFIGETKRIAARFDDRQWRISAGCLVSEPLLRFRSIPYLSRGGRDLAECHTLVLAAPQLRTLASERGIVPIQRNLKQPIALSQRPKGAAMPYLGWAKWSTAFLEVALPC
jgi:hypothetical protein